MWRGCRQDEIRRGSQHAQAWYCEKKKIAKEIKA
jgi:hypothetical protein